jgi:3-oxosteroid 1-dehydrogenase
MDGAPIPGLCGAGNAVASIFGAAYPGGGATLGPGVTFGCVAGLTLTS